MWSKYCLLLCTALSAAVKVDLLGSLTLGSDIADFLSHYVKEDLIDTVSARRTGRTMTDGFLELLKVVKQIQPCKGLPFCDQNLQNLLVDYVSDLLFSIKSVFDGVFDDELCKVRYFQKSLKHFKKVVRNTTVDSDEVYRWLNVLKRISGSFVEQSISLTRGTLDDIPEKAQVIRALRRELVLKLVDVERDYQKKLCKDFAFCPYQYDATIYLQLLLNIIKNMNDTNLKLFLIQFRNNFLRAPMLAEDAAIKEKFDDVLKEMLYEKSTKNIILSISDVVQKRLSVTESTEKDSVLLQMILADLDHLYANNQHEPIEAFLDKIKGWLRSNDAEALGRGMDSFYNGVASVFGNQPEELVSKLKMEVLVFLDITVDPTHTG